MNVGRPPRPLRAGQGARRGAGGAPALLYAEDLAFIHHAGFSEFAASASGGIIDTLRRHAVQTVADIGCGSGILARELSLAGFEVVGVDASPAMIELARANAPDARFKVARFADLLTECDAVVAIGEVLNHGTFEEVRSFIERVRARVLLFDVAESVNDGEHRSGGEDWSVIVTQESNTRRVLTFRKVGGEVRRSEESHELVFHDRAAMLALLRANGFRVKVRRSYGSRRLPQGHAVYECVKRERSSGGISGQASLVRPKIR